MGAFIHLNYICFYEYMNIMSNLNLNLNLNEEEEINNQEIKQLNFLYQGRRSEEIVCRKKESMDTFVMLSTFLTGFTISIFLTLQPSDFDFDIQNININSNSTKETLVKAKK